jgi:hypothetical protein
MTLTNRLLLLVEGVSFGLAALTHAGILMHGYEHRQAMIAESVIALVLLTGLGLTWVWPLRLRLIGGAAQTFALLGTLVGVFTIVVGVGPRTVPDVAYHVAMLAVLGWGLSSAVRSSTGRLMQPA